MRLAGIEKGGFYPYPPHLAEATTSWIFPLPAGTRGRLLDTCAGRTEIAGVAYITGRITVELDGKAYSHADAGRCIFNGDTPEALDMAIAGAVTDCLKRCFRQLGEQVATACTTRKLLRQQAWRTALRTDTDRTEMGNRHRRTRLHRSILLHPRRRRCNTAMV